MKNKKGKFSLRNGTGRNTVQQHKEMRKMSEMTRTTKRMIRTMAMIGIVLALFSAVVAADIRLDVPMFDQQDKTWADDPLGSCSHNISEWGCAITSIAMIFKYYGVDTNPRDMNNWLKENEGYNPNGCNVKWTVADKRSNGIVDWIGEPPASLDRIKSELDNRYPVIAKVMIPLTSGGETGHYVVVTGYSEIETESGIKTTLYINDPVGGRELTIPSASGGRYPGTPEEEVLKIRLYHGPVIQIIDQSISPTVAKLGSELTFVYNISNPYVDKVPKIRLGAQVRTNDPQGEWTDDMGNDIVIDLVSGANDYSRLFKLPLDSKPGFYDARWVIINESTKKPIHSKEMIRIFEVQSYSALDLIFLFDTTGSMGNYIANVQASANEILEALDFKGVDYRVAVADYRDHSSHTYRLDLPFTTKDGKQDIVNAINGLYVSGGGDWPESVYSALVKAMIDTGKDNINNPDNYGWRKGVSKAIILMGDAPPHIPEFWTGGYSLSDVIYWSENIDPVVVYSVVVGSSEETYVAFSEISEETGGKVYLATDASEVADAIIEAIGDIGNDEIVPDIYVPDNFSTIQSAVNAANESDLILVREGTYPEEYIDIDKRLSLITEGEVVVEGFSNGAFVFKINADCVNLTGFQITGENNYAGISLCSDNSKIENVTILNSNSAGIRLLSSDKNIIKGCTINSGTGNGNGIYLYHAEENIITGNVIENNYRGFDMLNSPNNEILGNDITNSGNRGICVYRSPGVSVIGNNISDNNMGAYLMSSHNSSLYHNNFFGNVQNAYEYARGTPKSSWDNGEEGNYWDDYDGVDANNDSIGDTPRTGGRVEDNYPLMDLWEE